MRHATLTSMRPCALKAHCICLFIFATVLTALVATGQSIRWDPSSGSFPRNQETRLDLIFENCEPKGEITLPKVDGLSFGTPSTNRQQSFNLNFGGGANQRQSYSSTTFSYPVRAEQRPEIRIPAFTVETDRGKIAVEPVVFTVGEAKVDRAGTTLEDVASSHFSLPKESVWAGQIFPLTYRLNLAERLSPRLAGSIDWNSAPLVTEDWPKEPQITRFMRAGQNLASVTYNTRAFSPQTGVITLAIASQPVGLATGRDFFGMASYTTYTISTAPASITVKPLPQPAPATFHGAVGDFTLTSKVVPEKGAVGEPITWTLELSGTGNWPAITALPPRNVSKDFRIVQPRAQKTQKDNSLFDATLSEDVILIPTKPGTYTLAPVEITVFDPASGQYKNLITPATTIEAVAAAQPNASPSAQISNPSPGPAHPPSDAGKPTVGSQPTLPAPPSGIPRDPLSSAAPAATPLSTSSLLLLALPLALWPLPLWFYLALRRARATDPLRPRREARERLAETLRQLRQNGADANDNTTAALLAWQHDAAILWNIHAAAPHARHFEDSEWGKLWRETDRVLYQRDTQLASDWIDSAEKTLSTTRLPRFSPWRAFLPKNIAPFLTALVIVSAVLCTLPSAHASDTVASGISNPKSQIPAAIAAYTAADFKAAETAWRNQIATTPTDWTARHNLSLALAQQDRWPESASQAIAAFVQHPRNESVNWQLHLALSKAGYTPPETAPFISDSPLGNLAQQASPIIWQYLLAGGILLLALALALALARAYRRLGRWSSVLATLILISGLLAVIASVFSLHIYGSLRDTRSALIWRATTLYSVPTEVDEAQKTTPASAGTIVIMEKAYLGWQRVRFPNGQTGWLRTENLTPLWR